MSKMIAVTKTQLHHTEVTEALGGLISIEPRIHKVRLSTMAKYSELEECLPDFKPRIADGQMPGYDWMAYVWPRGYQYKLYGGGDPWLPRAIFDVVEPPPASLVRLEKWMRSDVFVASAEYAIDFICQDHQAAQRVFWLLRKYLYFPWRSGSVETLGGPVNRQKAGYEENSLTRYWNRPNKITGKSNNVVRLYERGNDDDIDPVRPRWLMADVNRVRLEFLFSNRRHKGMFKKHWLRDLKGFVTCPLMSEVLRGKFRFAAFKGIATNDLPAEWMSYSAMDDSGYAECFHQERKEAVGTVSNLSMYTVDSPMMAPLMRRVQSALLEYDVWWVEEATRARRVRVYKDFDMCFRDREN